jgi:hypothetical protein
MIHFSFFAPFPALTFPAHTAYSCKLTRAPATPKSIANELTPVAVSACWLCLALREAFRFRRGVGILGMNEILEMIIH